MKTYGRRKHSKVTFKTHRKHHKAPSMKEVIAKEGVMGVFTRRYYT